MMESSRDSAIRPNFEKLMLLRNDSSSPERTIPSLLVAFTKERAALDLKSASVMSLPNNRSTSIWDILHLFLLSLFWDNGMISTALGDSIYTNGAKKPVSVITAAYLRCPVEAGPIQGHVVPIRGQWNSAVEYFAVYF
jgi:hypothetical protein